MTKTIKISNNDIILLLNSETIHFPKYATQIMNLANQNAGGTRPKVVGQMSELIKEFKGKKIEEWEEWYLNEHPEAIAIAANKVLDMVNNFKSVINEIDLDMIKNWVRDLVIIKTFVGLKFQEAILKSVADYFQVSYSLAEPSDEAKGIDGFINDNPISIKPGSYSSKQQLPETINEPIIFYEKLKDGIRITFSENLL